MEQACRFGYDKSYATAGSIKKQQKRYLCSFPYLSNDELFFIRRVYLVLPKEYTDYKQTNLNIYTEFPRPAIIGSEGILYRYGSRHTIDI